MKNKLTSKGYSEEEISQTIDKLVSLKYLQEEEYKKLEMLSRKEKGKEKRVTKKFIDNLKKGKG